MECVDSVIAPRRKFCCAIIRFVCMSPTTASFSELRFRHLADNASGAAAVHRSTDIADVGPFQGLDAGRCLGLPQFLGAFLGLRCHAVFSFFGVPLRADSKSCAIAGPLSTALSKHGKAVRLRVRASTEPLAKHVRTVKKKSEVEYFSVGACQTNAVSVPIVSCPRDEARPSG
jgi:hypothetical protein